MLKDIAALMNMTEEEIKTHPHLLVNAFDHQHRVLFWNKQCESFFGISQDKALGKILEDIVPYSRDNKKMEHLEKALSGHPVYLANETYDNKKGFYDQVVLPLKDVDGNVIAAVNIVIDLTFMNARNPMKFSLLKGLR